MTARADAACHSAFLSAVAEHRRSAAVDDPFTCELPSPEDRRARQVVDEMERAEGARELLRELLEEYVARLVHGPKRVYAAGVVASVLDGAMPPVAPDAAWVADVDRKVARWRRRAEVWS